MLYAEYMMGFSRLTFLAPYLRGMRDVKTLDALSSQVWFGPSLLPGKPLNSPYEINFICPFVVLSPSNLGATIVVAQGQMPSEFLPSPDADCLPFE
jgi:hypothetical protein